MEISFSLAQSENIKPLLSDIMKNARISIGAERASLFLIDESISVLATFIADGGKLPPTMPLTNGIAATCARSKGGIIENDVYHSPLFNRSIDINTGFKTTSILACPILSNEGKLLGVVEMINKEANKDDGKFTNKDLNLLNAFASFSAVALENSRLKDVATYGDIGLEVTKWIGESERTEYEIPRPFLCPIV